MNWTKLRTAATLTRRFCSTPTTPPSSSTLSYTAGIATPLHRSPNLDLTPRSRKEIPYKVRSRNATGPYEVAGFPQPDYPKRKSPFKRCKALINAITEEETLRMKESKRSMFPLKVPDPQSGDIIRVAYVRSIVGDDEPLLYFTGIAIAVRRRGMGSMVILRNVIDGIAVERGFPFYSPLIKDATVIGKKKNSKRSKLYYLRSRPLRQSTVSNATRPPPDQTRK